MKFFYFLFLLLSFSLTVGDINAQANPKYDFNDLNSSLEENFAKDFEFSVLVERNDSVLFSEHYGFIDKNNSVPVDEETLFNIASISKSITAVGIFKLIEQKVLHLEDTLDLFFDNVSESKKSITILNLLSHQSGLRQTYPLDGMSESGKALEAILKQELEFTPGSNFRYSNQNYQMLAMIIEKVTKTRFEEYMRENVLLPLNMEDTYFWDEVGEDNNLAPVSNSIRRNIGNRNWGFLGSTGIFTTTSDLSKFWNGVYKNDFLSNESIDVIFQPYYETKSGTQICLGFFIYPTTKWNTTELWTKGTESWGHNSAIRFFPEKKLLIIVSINSGEIDNDRGMTGNKLVSDLIADFLLE